MENNKNSKIFYGWWVVLGCVLITTTMVPPIMSLSNKFLIQVTTEMNISRGAFTLANTIVQGLGIFISPIVSKNLAKGNMRKIQSISIIGFVLAYASYSLAKSPIHLYMSSFFVGLFYLNSTLIPVSMMVTNWFVEKRGIAMSVTMAGIGLGGTIFSPIVTNLLQNYGWRHTYLIMAGIILVVALPVASMYDLNGSYTLAWMLLLVLTAVTLFSWVGSCLVAKRYMASDVELKQAQ
ncbi:MAG: MFS transporter [Intestinibacter bartlettii]|uniref:MFS transporter n=1 Tax=Intestinibacter bartlettii TaxID=261299 RepID=UPI0026EFB95D|nr:MFS transporter [Intestinibacter bartlettii]MDO5011774.1 MFS transporter [Intestinibacter bartlettii]